MNEYLGAKRADRPAHVHGSTLGTCSACHAKVWLSPASQAHLATNPNIKVICVVPCALLLDVPDDGIEIKPVPGSKIELQDWLDGRGN